MKVSYAVIALFLAASFSMSSASAEPRRYKLVPGPNNTMVKDYLDPLHLPAAIADAVSAIFVFGGSTYTVAGPEKSKVYGWIAVVAGSATGCVVESIDGRSEVQVSLRNGTKKTNVPTELVLNSIEGDSLFISRGLGNVEVVDDIASASKMTSRELAIAVVSAKTYADKITGGKRFATDGSAISKSIFENSFTSLSSNQRAIAANYLALRNIEVVL